MDKESINLILNKIGVLAQALGTTAEQLWMVAIAQAKIEAFVIILIYIAFVISVSLLVKCVCLCESNGWESKENYGSLTKHCIYFIISAICTLGFGIASIANTAKFITCCVNPEYFALKLIMNGIN